jgi:hypothetical protein
MRLTAGVKSVIDYQTKLQLSGKLSAHPEPIAGMVRRLHDASTARLRASLNSPLDDDFNYGVSGYLSTRILRYSEHYDIYSVR